MKKVAKAALGLMVVTLISKVLGFVRELVLANAYGVSAYSDAYLVALNIPIIIFEVIGLAVTTTFIPLYYDNEKKGGKVLSNQFTNSVYNIVLIITILISIFLFINSDKVVKIFAMGFEGETLKIATDFTKILIFGIIFIALASISRAYLNANENFVVSNLMMGIPYNIIVIISIIFSVKYDPYILAYGTLIAIASKFICQIPFVNQYGYKYKLEIKLKDESLRKMIYLVLPIFVGVSVNQLNALIDRSIASTLVEGSISALNYSNRLNLFVMAIFTTSISTVIYPMLSKYSINEDVAKFKNSVVESINFVLILVVPVCIGAIALAKPIVEILFERGAFDERATSMTASALAFYSVGMIGFGLRDILSKVFYSLQDTKTPMINASLSMMINIILNLLLVRYMGHNGLALATSISSIVCIILLFRSLNKKIGNIGMKNINATMMKSLIAAVIMGEICVVLYNILQTIMNIQIISLGLSILVSMIIYLVLIIKLRVEETDILINIIKKIGKRIKRLSIKGSVN